MNFLVSRFQLFPASRIFLLTSILIACCFFPACKQTTSIDYDKEQIEQILYQIDLAFESHDIAGIMYYFHQDYLHDGLHMWQIEEEWQNRMDSYQLIEFQNVQIRVDGDEATVTFTMKLESDSEIILTDEPASHGDISYFYYSQGKWLVYGNQHRASEALYPPHPCHPCNPWKTSLITHKQSCKSIQRVSYILLSETRYFFCTDLFSIHC